MLSIIMPVHNGFEYVKPCIQSLIRNTTDFELIIWDNASDLQTRTFLRDSVRYYKHKIIYSKENLGFIVPCNRAIKEATGEFISIVNSDMIFGCGWAKMCEIALKSDERIGLVGAFGYGTKSDGTATVSGNISYIEGSLLFFRKKLYDEIGLFDEGFNFGYVEDVDFSFKVRAAGYKIKKLNLPVNHLHAKTREKVIKYIDLHKIEQENREYLIKKWKNLTMWDWLINEKT